jgi:hypothetical protein
VLATVWQQSPTATELFYVAVTAGRQMQNADQLTFNGLATELQRLVVNSPPLELDDLAKAARTCKFFSAVASERRAADEQWLAKAAVSAFGERFIELLLFVLTDPVADGIRCQTFDLTTGKPFPSHDDVRGLSLVILFTATPGGDPINWSVTKGVYRNHLKAWSYDLASGFRWDLVHSVGDDEEEFFLSRFTGSTAPGDSVSGAFASGFHACSRGANYDGKKSVRVAASGTSAGTAQCIFTRLEHAYESVQYPSRDDARPLPEVTRAMNVFRMGAWRLLSRLRYFHTVMPLQLLSFELNAHTPV